jgi:hypothetical protein
MVIFEVVLRFFRFFMVFLEYFSGSACSMHSAHAFFLNLFYDLSYKF